MLSLLSTRKRKRKRRGGQKHMKEEQKHFDECQEIIRQNIFNYEEKVEKGRKETEELYAAVTPEM